MRIGWFDSLHPLTKLTWAFSLAVHIYLATTMPLSIICWGLAVLTPLTAATPRALYRTLWGIFIPVGLSLFLLQGVFFPSDTTHMWQIGGVNLSVGGMLVAATSLMRIMTLGSGLLCVVLTTPPAHLTQALAERGLPRSIEYILLMALQIIPDMRLRAHGILEAQQSRGLIVDSLIRRIGAIVPLIGPLVVGALIDVEERAMSLELRAFAHPAPPTRMVVLRDTRQQHWARTGLLLSVVGVAAATAWSSMV
jgi:energy-coupling factor transport system permease protein